MNKLQQKQTSRREVPLNPKKGKPLNRNQRRSLTNKKLNKRKQPRNNAPKVNKLNILNKKKSQTVLKNLFLNNSEKPALAPIEQFVSLDYSAWSQFMMTLTAFVSMRTSLFIQQSSTTSFMTPGEFAMYCYISTCYFVNKVGTLEQYDPGYFIMPSSMDWQVPTPLAKWLQQLAPYTEGGAILKTKFVMTTSNGIAFNFPDSVNGFAPPTTLSSSAVTLRATALLTLDTVNVVEYLLSADGSLGMTMSDFLVQRAPVISKLITSSDLSSISVDAIPTFAPCGSAYALPNFVVSANIYPNCWNSLVCNVSNDVAMMFAGATALSNGVDYYPQGGYCVSFATTNSIGTSELPNDPFINTFVNCWFYATKYRKGPILKTTKLCKLPVTTLMPIAVYIDATLLPRIWGGIYGNIMNNQIGSNQVAPTPSNLNADTNFNIFLAGEVAAMMMTLYRINRTSMSYNFYDVVSSHQQYYASDYWGTIPMPAVFNAAMADLGPVVHCGVVHTPVFSINPGGPTTPYQRLANNLTSAFLPDAYVFATPWAPISNGSAPTIVPNFYIDSQQISNINIAPYIINRATSGTTAIAGVYGINANARGLVDIMNQLWTQFNTGPNYFSQLVHPHATFCGSTVAILGRWSYDQTNTPSTNYELCFPESVNVQKIAGAAKITWNYLVQKARYLDQLFCNVQVSSSQVTRAMISCWGVTRSAITTLRFSVKLGTPYSMLGFAKNAMAVTCVPESMFGKSVAIEEQRVHDAMKELKVGPLVVGISGGVGCIWNDLLNEALVAINPIARRSIGMIGESVLGKPGGVIADRMYEWIATNIATEANDIKKPIYGNPLNRKKVDLILNNIIEVLGQDA